MKISELKKLKTRTEPEREKRACELQQLESRRRRKEPFFLPYFRRAHQCVTLPLKGSLYREETTRQTLYHEVLNHTMENTAFVTITKLKGERKK